MTWMWRGRVRFHSPALHWLHVNTRMSVVVRLPWLVIERLKRCVASNYSNTLAEDVSLFRFPRDVARHRQWVLQVKRTCARWDFPAVYNSDHFEADCFNWYSSVKLSVGYELQHKRVLLDRQFQQFSQVPLLWNNNNKQPQGDRLRRVPFEFDYRQFCWRCHRHWGLFNRFRQRKIIDQGDCLPNSTLLLYTTSSRKHMTRTTNNCESMNHLIKLSSNWKACRLTDLVDKLRAIARIHIRGLLYKIKGNYQLSSKWNSSETLWNTKICCRVRIVFSEILPRGQSGVPGEELAADFLECWNRQARSINRQLHALAATDDAVDVLVHEHFSRDFLTRGDLHLNLRGNRCLLRGITGAIHRIRHVINLSISIVQVWKL